MAFEKEIAHTLYSAYEVYLDLKAQLRDVQQLRLEQLESIKSAQGDLSPESSAQTHAHAQASDSHDEMSSNKRKPPPTIEDHEQQVHKDLDMLAKKMESLVQILTQNHTTAPAMLVEFENLRTFKIMSGEPFALSGVLPLKAKK